MTQWAATTDEVGRWVGEQVDSDVTVELAKVRPWAVVWQATDDRDRSWWAKQNCPGQAFEAELVAVLARLAPAYVVPVAAADTRRGLLLTPDQGQVFAETVRDDDIDAWVRLVQRAMELARATADHGADLLATGLTASRVPESVADRVARAREEAGAAGLPDTLVHNDLHEHNAFDDPAGLRFFDFADAVWDHPLTGLLVPLNMLASHLGDPGPDDGRMRRVADAALEVWTDRASLAELRRALAPALRLGRLARAESWARIEPHLDSGDLDDFGGAVDAWLDRLDDPLPVSFA
ncbi:hypothetical protein GCM10009623_34320 [Nocardioides aestuarii]|uniref:Aminoglycoside phosphotransferase domain-containing protein n=1 Tax=Nocardioides aestuarii TaxID=252231 RepID=A0ABW4TSU8_9ACTN